jgi:hypothetical protein
MLVITFELTLNVIIEKHSILGIDKMQYFLYQDIKYKFKLTNKVNLIFKIIFESFEICEFVRKL